MKSAAWGGTDQPISQGYDVYNADADALGWYDYVTQYGLDKGHHGGLDISMDKGTRLQALNPGKVIQAGFADSFRPNPVWIETDDNPETRTDESGFVEIWGHMWTNAVKTGDRVKPGQFLGASGEQTVRGTMTPDGSGPHLHFELRQGGTRLVDPTGWLTRTGAGIPGPESDGDDAGDDEGTNTDSGPAGLPTGLLEAIRGLLGRTGFALLGAAIMLIGLVILVGGYTPAGRAWSLAKRVRRAIK
jgi:hypothetical protein